MKSTAVLAIDLQKGLFHANPPPVKVDNVTENIKLVLKAARENGYEVIMVQHQESEKEGNLIPATEPWMICDEFLSTDSETVVHKEHADAFMDTDLDLVLKADNIDHVIICGMESDACVISTAEGALKRGLRITAVEDGHTQGHVEGSAGEKIISDINKKLNADGVKVLSSSEIASELKNGNYH